MSVELFDWEERWNTEIVPLLEKPSVKKSLRQYAQEKGMTRERRFMGKSFLPYQCGREPKEGWKTYSATELKAYKPIGDCHWIWRFPLAIGRLLHPDLEWAKVSSETHTVAVGYRKDAEGFPQ